MNSWTTPDFKEISLCFEVTAYVNTGADQQRSQTERSEPVAKQ